MPSKEKKLRLWNGRWRDRRHVYVAAYSKADASRLLMQAWGRSNGSFISEITNYFSECWGNPMESVTPERGVWVSRENGLPPERVVDSSGQLCCAEKTVEAQQESPVDAADSGMMSAIRRILHFATGGCDLPANDRLKCIARECEAELSKVE